MTLALKVALNPDTTKQPSRQPIALSFADYNFSVVQKVQFLLVRVEIIVRLPAFSHFIQNVVYPINSLPNDKTTTLTNLKAFADDKLNVDFCI